MLKANNISFSYNKNETFLSNLCVEFEEGKITTILGPNGSGKSTLLSLLSGQNKVKEGEIILNNRNISKLKYKEISKEISTVHQQNSVPNDLTVRELISYGRLPFKKSFQGLDNEDEEIVNWAIKETSLEEYENKIVMNLSGGERQRVYIAMALVQQPKILFLDEPTTYLDIYHQLEVLELVKRLNKEHKTTIIMVLHDINQALKYSHNVVIMKKGRLLYSGEVEEGITEERIFQVYKVKGEIIKGNFVF